MKEPRAQDLSEEYQNMMFMLADKVQLSEVIGQDFRLTYSLLPDDQKKLFIKKLMSFHLSELGNTLEALTVLGSAVD